MHLLAYGMNRLELALESSLFCPTFLSGPAAPAPDPEALDEDEVRDDGTLDTEPSEPELLLNLKGSLVATLLSFFSHSVGFVSL